MAPPRRTVVRPVVKPVVRRPPRAPVRPARPVQPKIQPPPAGGWTDWVTQTGRRPTAAEGPDYTLRGAFESGYLTPAGLEDLFAPGELSVGIPGYHPNLAGAVEGDWELGAAQADIEAANRAAEAAAGEQINALAVGWGGDLSDMVRQGLISQGAADAAKANQFSQMAELGRTLQTGLGQGYSQLAARGILQSGAMPGLTAELNRGYQQQTQRGLQNLMGSIRDIRGQVASGAAQRRQSLAGVRAGVAQRLASMEAYQPIPDMVAQWDPAAGAYVDNWGRRFNAAGRRLS